MASVFRPKGRRNYYLAYFDPVTRKRHTVRGYVDKRATEALAVDLERRAARVAAGLEPRPIATQRLIPLVDEYLKTLRVSTEWLDTVDKRLSRVLPAYSDQIDSKLLDSLNVKGQTYKQYRSILTRFCQWLVDRGCITQVPSFPARPLDAKRLRAAYTVDELKRLFKHRRYGLLFMTACYTGLRKSELRRLRWCDVSTEGVTLPGSPRRKNKESTTLPLHPDLAKRLRPRASVAPVFVDFPGRKMFRSIQSALGIDRVDIRGRVKDFHSLRYSFATLLAASGTPLLIAQQLLRHSDPRLTASLYKDLGDETLAQAIGRISVSTSVSNQRA